MIINYIPNILSVSRIIATGIIVIFILINQPWSFFAAAVLFLLAGLTDYFDGYVARYLNVASSFGVFLDLTADKILVSSVLIALVQIGIVAGWIVMVIISREFLVMGLRSISAAKGKVIPADRLGKQ